MIILDDILNVLLPDGLTHLVFKFADRFKSQHFLVLGLALCMTGFNSCVGQAGVSDIHQVQVSNYHPVPNHSLVAQPQILFIVHDQHLNRPSFQIVGHDGFHGSMKVVRNQGHVLAFASAAREHHLDHSQLVECTPSLRQAIGVGLSKTSGSTPLAAVSKDIFAVPPKFAFNRAYGEPPVGLINANIMPAFLFIGMDDRGAKIEDVKHDGDLERCRQACLSNSLGRQVGKLTKRELQCFNVFFLDIQLGTPRCGYTTILEIDFHDSMSETRFAGGMMAKLTDGVHFLTSLKRLCVINDQEEVSVVFVKQTLQHVHGNRLHHLRFTPAASPQKLPVIRSVGRSSQVFGEAFYGTPMTYGDRQNHMPKVSPCSLCERASKQPEKTPQFSQYFADSNHTASPAITCLSKKCYRLGRPFLLDNCYHHNRRNQSV